jgi:pre-mRNA-processing factor 6
MKEQQEGVVSRAVAAEPHHGERWQKIAKAVENAHEPVETLLKKVAKSLATAEAAAAAEGT